jgi:hypothetical protein
MRISSTLRVKANVYLNYMLTFKDLKKRVSLEIAQQQSGSFERLHSKPFWIWNIEEHKHEDVRTNGDCCFNYIAIKLIKRMKGLFEPKLAVTFDSKETVLELNGCSIEAYPSNHIDAYRALDNPKFILIEEYSFAAKGIAKERYLKYCELD